MLQTNTLTTSATATKNSKELIDFIYQNKQSIGLIGSNYFSNMDDSTARIILPKIKIIGIKSGNQVNYPFQANIAAKKYPYVRSVYVLNTEHYYGKYTGFKNFMISPTGQRIILKSGLLPLKMPSRMLNFVKSKNE